MNLIEIAKAWIISFNPNKEQKQIAESRIEKCNTCEHSKYNGLFGLVLCDLCKCPLNRKIFGINSCELNKWDI